MRRLSQQQHRFYTSSVHAFEKFLGVEMFQREGVAVAVLYERVDGRCRVLGGGLRCRPEYRIARSHGAAAFFAKLT